MNEEIRDVTWGLDGARLEPWQAAQRLYRAGFVDVRILAIMWAVLEGESGRFLKAWHHNVVRDDEGMIVRDPEGRFTCKSTDLGFIQRNVVHTPPVKLHDAEGAPFAESLFEAHPELARGDRSAEIAFALYQDRGFQPWYAYSNKTYRRHLAAAVEAVRNFLGVVFGLTLKR